MSSRPGRVDTSDTGVVTAGVIGSATAGTTGVGTAGTTGSVIAGTTGVVTTDATGIGTAGTTGAVATAAAQATRVRDTTLLRRDTTLLRRETGFLPEATHFLREITFLRGETPFFRETTRFLREATRFVRVERRLRTPEFRLAFLLLIFRIPSDLATPMPPIPPRRAPAICRKLSRKHPFCTNTLHHSASGPPGPIPSRDPPPLPAASFVVQTRFRQKELSPALARLCMQLRATPYNPIRPLKNMCEVLPSAEVSARRMNEWKIANGESKMRGG
jgi:hypothetical protein